MRYAAKERRSGVANCVLKEGKIGRSKTRWIDQEGKKKGPRFGANRSDGHELCECENFLCSSNYIIQITYLENIEECLFDLEIWARSQNYLFIEFNAPLFQLNNYLFIFILIFLLQIRNPKDETQCLMCPLGTIPDRGRNVCLEIPEAFLRAESAWAISAMTISALGNC